MCGKNNSIPADRDDGGEAAYIPSGGRSWWAHCDFTRINIRPTILRKKIEDAREVSAIVSVRAAAALWL
jgi:hypothetical protein